MSDDWKVGDLAVCVDARVHPRYPRFRVAEGAVYTVREVCFSPIGNKMFGPGIGLVLTGCAGGPLAAARFRKIRPDEHTPCEEEFATLLKRRKGVA